ncbi:MAG: glycosyltransferase [Nitrospira sp.]|nr:glycosyltransferase [Nitrospira sp.]
MSVVRKFGTKVLGLVHRVLGNMLERFNPSIQNQVVRLNPDGPIRGHVLLSYRIEFFLKNSNQPVTSYHPSWVVTQRMATKFLNFGFVVDVISNQNKGFLPEKDYTFFIDTRMNFERLAPKLNKDCVKVLHVTTAHPYFHNAAEANRLMALQERKHVTVRSRRFMPLQYALAVEYADCLTVPSEFCIQTFRYANKPFHVVPNPAEFVYPWTEGKNFESCRSQFLWLGSEGMVHKGLDLVLEAFAGMPEYHLTVCGPVANEKDFERVYDHELYHTPNIHTFGWIDIGSPEFVNLAARCVGLVYPSCSEGSAGAVITCLHAGLIPIISHESGVDISNDAGVVLADCSIEAIREAVRQIATASPQELKRRARTAWEFARANHTMENFENQYEKMIGKLIADYQK